MYINVFYRYGLQRLYTAAFLLILRLLSTCYIIRHSEAQDRKQMRENRFVGDVVSAVTQDALSRGSNFPYLRDEPSKSTEEPRP